MASDTFSERFPYRPGKPGTPRAQAQAQATLAKRRPTVTDSHGSEIAPDQRLTAVACIAACSSCRVWTRNGGACLGATRGNRHNPAELPMCHVDQATGARQVDWQALDAAEEIFARPASAHATTSGSAAHIPAEPVAPAKGVVGEKVSSLPGRPAAVPVGKLFALVLAIAGVFVTVTGGPVTASSQEPVARSQERTEKLSEPQAMPGKVSPAEEAGRAPGRGEGLSHAAGGPAVSNTSGNPEPQNIERRPQNRRTGPDCDPGAVGHSEFVIRQSAVLRQFVVTAYCPCRICCGRWAAFGRFADGGMATGHAVAAPRWLPLGTRLAVPGYAGGRPVVARDRGGAIRGDRLDVFFPTHEQARAWGVRRLLVEVIPSRPPATGYGLLATRSGGTR